MGISTVGIDLPHDPSALSLAQEPPGLPLGVGEVDEEPVAGDAQQARDDALEDEDPAPAAEPGAAAELHQAEGEDAGEGGGDAAEDVEEGVALADLVARVPGRQQVHAAGEEARLEDAEDHPQRRQRLERLHEPHPDHDRAPRHRDRG